MKGHARAKATPRRASYWEMYNGSLSQRSARYLHWHVLKDLPSRWLTGSTCQGIVIRRLLPLLLCTWALQTNLPYAFTLVSSYLILQWHWMRDFENYRQNLRSAYSCDLPDLQSDTHKFPYIWQNQMHMHGNCARAVHDGGLLGLLKRSEFPAVTLKTK